MQSTGPMEQLRPRIRVVVVNYDGGEVTRRCIDALLATNYPADRLEIVVVDNASVDGLNWVLMEHYPQVRLIESLVNEGFARGCNLAMGDLDEVDHVALINNDAFVDPDWLEPLLASMDDPTVGAASPKLLLNVEAHALTFDTSELHQLDQVRRVGVSVDRIEVDGDDVTGAVRFDERFHHEHPHEVGRWTKGFASVWWPVGPDVGAQRVRVELHAAVSTEVTVGVPGGVVSVEVGPEGTVVECTVDQRVHILNSAGGGLYKGWFGGDRGFLEPDIGQYDEPCEVFSWCGGAVLLRAEYLTDVGIFDSTYFLYYEDFDLAWRGRTSGWRYRYVPSARVFHEHAYSSKAGSAFFTFWVDRNRRLTLLKNAPWRVAVRAAAGAAWHPAVSIARHSVSRIKRLRPPSPRFVVATVKGFWSFAGAVPSALAERRRLRRRQVVSDRVIESWTITK